MTTDPLSASDVINFASSAVTVVGGLVQLMSEIAGERRRIRYAESSVGSLGTWFHLTWASALSLAHVLLFFVTILAAFALAGTAKWFGGVAQEFAMWLFANGPILLLAYVAFALAVHLRLAGKMWFYVAQIKARYSPRTAFDPGLINAEWLFLRGTAEPTLLNVDRIRCEMVASFLFRIPSEKTASDRALAVDEEWLATNRANAILFACAIEGVVHELPGGRKRKLSELFSAFYSAEAEIWSSASVASGRTIEAIPRLLKSTTTLADLADEQAVLTVVRKTAIVLQESYAGNAVSLAGGRIAWMTGAAVEHVVSNLREFPALDGARRPGRDVQFLKLALEAKIWPGMSPEFIYPFSRNVAMFLLNTGCLVCTPGTQRIVIDPLFVRLVGAAEEIIVESAAEILGRQPGLGAGLRLPASPSRWQLARSVDYTIWWLSRQPSGWRLRVDELDGEAAKSAPSPKWTESFTTLNSV